MKREISKTKRSFILTISLLAIVGYFVITLIYLQTEIKTRGGEAAQIEQKIQEQQLENAELGALLESGNEEEYIERIARDSLGYVKIGEKVYKEISPSD